MAIENVMIKTNLVSNFAVCCTTRLTLETINEFLAQVHEKEGQESSPPTLTIVHDLAARLWGPTKELRGEDRSTLVQSPFIDADYTRIREVLRDMVDATGSALATDWFLVLDEKSKDTSSAVMVNVGAMGVRSLRVDYPVSSRYLAAVSIAHPSIDELGEVADAKLGGILQD